MMDSKESFEEDGNIPDQIEDPLLGTEDVSRRRSETSWTLYLHGGLISLYTLLFVLLVSFRPEPTAILPNSALIPTNRTQNTLPDGSKLIWEQRRFLTNIENNPFAGKPRPALDKAWHDLLRNDNIKVPKEYLDQHDLTSIYTKNGSEGIVSLSVFHSLHCLKKVKRMLFKDYYHHGKSDDAMQREAKHVDHCVEYIREALMCQPDLSMVTFRWINNTAQHPEDKSGFYPTNFDVDSHTCANWEALNSWASERTFNLFEVELLQRPGSMEAFL